MTKSTIIHQNDSQAHVFCMIFRPFAPWQLIKLAYSVHKEKLQIAKV
jgi:hypothetical protein